jgi:hypothetical protein
MKDFQKDYVKNHLGLLSPDEVLEHFTPDKVLQRLSLKDRLKGITPEEIELYLLKHGKKTGQ